MQQASLTWGDWRGASPVVTFIVPGSVGTADSVFAYSGSAQTLSAPQKPLQQIAFGPGAHGTWMFPVGEQQHRRLLPAGLHISPCAHKPLSPVGQRLWRQLHTLLMQSAPAGQVPPEPQVTGGSPQTLGVPPPPQTSGRVQSPHDSI